MLTLKELEEEVTPNNEWKFVRLRDKQSMWVHWKTAKNIVDLVEFLYKNQKRKWMTWTEVAKGVGRTRQYVRPLIIILASIQNSPIRVKASGQFKPRRIRQTVSWKG